MHVPDQLISLSGVLLIVGLVWWAMGSALASVGNEVAVRGRIAGEQPDFTIGVLGLGADGRSALAISDDGREAILLFALGSEVVCWRFPRLRLSAKLLPSPGAQAALLVNTGDFTRPSFRMALANAEVASALLAALQGPAEEVHV